MKEDLWRCYPNFATDGLPMNLVWLKTREARPKVSLLLKYLGEHLAPYGSVKNAGVSAR